MYIKAKLLDRHLLHVEQQIAVVRQIVFYRIYLAGRDAHQLITHFSARTRREEAQIKAIRSLSAFILYRLHVGTAGAAQPIQRPRFGI